MIFGIHFGRRVDIEYESVLDSGNSEERPPETQPEFSQAPLKTPMLPSYFLSNSQAIPHKIIPLSKKRYDEFIVDETVSV